eukprot:4674958-Prymnesium_polylepis.3
MLVGGALDIAKTAAPTALASDAVLGRAVLGAGLARELSGLLVRCDERGVLVVECRPPLLVVHLNLNLKLVLERAQRLGQLAGLALRVLLGRLPLLHRLELAREALV